MENTAGKSILGRLGAENKYGRLKITKGN